MNDSIFFSDLAKQVVMIVIALLIVVACVVLLYLGVEKFTQTTEAT